MQLNRYADRASHRAGLVLALILGVCVSTSYASDGAGPAWVLNRPATSFNRHYVTDPQYITKINSPDNRRGLAGADGLPVTGWFEYDFTAPKTGWYKLLITGENNGGGIEYIIDPLTNGDTIGRLYIYAVGTALPTEKVSNIWLSCF